jgi:hypothetical protein
MIASGVLFSRKGRRLSLEVGVVSFVVKRVYNGLRMAMGLELEPGDVDPHI